MTVPVLDDSDAAAFTELVAAESGRIGALLAGQLPHALVEAVEEAGVELLPYGGELGSACTCDGWLDPCPHALAVLTQLAWLIQADPFVLTHLRGLSRDRVLRDLHRITTPREQPHPGPRSPGASGPGTTSRWTTSAWPRTPLSGRPACWSRTGRSTPGESIVRAGRPRHYQSLGPGHDVEAVDLGVAEDAAVRAARLLERPAVERLVNPSSGRTSVVQAPPSAALSSSTPSPRTTAPPPSTSLSSSSPSRLTSPLPLSPFPLSLPPYPHLLSLYLNHLTKSS